MNNSPCDIEQLVGKQPSTDFATQLISPKPAFNATGIPSSILEKLLQGSTAQNVKRIGSHAILTDRMLGQGHYGKVYLGYELPSQNASAAARRQVTPSAKE
jgi:hypothetical protein